MDCVLGTGRGESRCSHIREGKTAEAKDFSKSNESEECRRAAREVEGSRHESCEDGNAETVEGNPGSDFAEMEDSHEA